MDWYNPAVSPSPQPTHKQQQEHKNACPSAEEEQGNLQWGWVKLT